MGFTALGDLLIYALCVAVGAYIGGRRELVASLRAQVEAANRERLGLEDRARLTERSRIAREMHDVLAHRISLVAMHAGALAYRTDLTREETAEAATVVRDNAHRALTELRQVLGVLRDPEAGHEPDRPQPTLCDLLELLAEFRATGARLQVEDGVGARAAQLPAPVGRNAYRIVQEALTNVRKHAPGRPAVLRLTGAPGDRLVIEVSNPLPVTDLADAGADRAPAVPGAGMGLTGLVERARLAGGELTYGHRPGHLFVVRAWLPWQT
ncbi:sensor histidine kinase [Cellulomonas soli]